MPVTVEDILNFIWREEPDYEGAVSLGPEAGPLLVDLVDSDLPGVAANAVSLASLLGDAGLPALQKAAVDHRPVVRVALAHALGNLGDLPDLVEPLAAQLLQDPDAGVRRLALISPTDEVRTRLRPMIETMMDGEPLPVLRRISRDVIEAMQPLP